MAIIGLIAGGLLTEQLFLGAGTHPYLYYCLLGLHCGITERETELSNMRNVVEICIRPILLSAYLRESMHSLTLLYHADCEPRMTVIITNHKAAAAEMLWQIRQLLNTMMTSKIIHTTTGIHTFFT